VQAKTVPLTLNVGVVTLNDTLMGELITAVPALSVAANVIRPVYEPGASEAGSTFTLSAPPLPVSVPDVGEMTSQVPLALFAVAVHPRGGLQVPASLKVTCWDWAVCP
jgi:hypothetical protein